MSIINKLKAAETKRELSRHRASNLLVCVSGHEGTGQDSVLIGINMSDNKPVRVRLVAEADVSASTDEDKERPNPQMLLSDDYAHKVEVGGLISCETARQTGKDGEWECRWMSSYQRKSTKGIASYLGTPPEQRPQKTEPIGLSGQATLNLREARTVQDENGENIQLSAAATLDVYMAKQATLEEISSIEELQSFIEKQISVELKLPVSATQAAMIRLLDGKESFVVGVPSQKRVNNNGVYGFAPVADVAASYVKSQLERSDSNIALLKQAFDEGQSFTMEAVPILKLPVGKDSLKSMKVFDREGKIRRSQEDAKPTPGEILEKMYREKAKGGNKVKLTATNISLGLHAGTNDPFVIKFRPQAGFEKSYTLDMLPTGNFNQQPEPQKAKSSGQSQRAEPQAPDNEKPEPVSKKPEAPAKQPSKVATPDANTAAQAAAQEPDPDYDMSEDDFAQIDAALDDLSLDMPVP